MSRKIRCYSELQYLKTFEERFDYLRLSGRVGQGTFGFDRIFNQKFYSSIEWKRIRDHVIVRDNCCDLGLEGFDIFERSILVHHMNPISLDDISKGSPFLLNPEYLITTTHSTHNAIHYGYEAPTQEFPLERIMNDTCPWKN